MNYTLDIPSYLKTHISHPNRTQDTSRLLKTMEQKKIEVAKSLNKTEIQREYRSPFRDSIDDENDYSREIKRENLMDLKT